MSDAINYLTSLISSDQLKLEQLEAEIHYLFHHEFERLTWILYRLDVDEKELTKALNEGNLPEEKIITQFLLERCTRLLATRKENEVSSSTDQWSFDLEEE